MTHLRISSREVNLIQFILPKDHSSSSAVVGGLNEERLMGRQDILVGQGAVLGRDYGGEGTQLRPVSPKLSGQSV